jgi:ribonuclease HII
VIVKPTLDKEKELWQRGIEYVGGVDEAGRGAWAGPVVAAVVILPKEHNQIENIRDSKLVTPKKRRELYHQILDFALDFGIGTASSSTIDEIGIAKATNLAYQEAIRMLSNKPEYLLIDAFKVEGECPQEAITKGDQKIYSISCASIIAKVYRDNLMENLDECYRIYEFSDHKGYGTKRHQELLAEYGPCDLHRFCYQPIRELI